MEPRPSLSNYNKKTVEPYTGVYSGTPSTDYRKFVPGFLPFPWLHTSHHVRNEHTVARTSIAVPSGFVLVEPGIYVNERTNEVGIRLIVAYPEDDDALWNSYLSHHEELVTLFHETIHLVNRDIEVKDVQIGKGSVIIFITTGLATVGAYSAVKELVKDIRAILPLLERKITKFFQSVGRTADNFLKRLFGTNRPQVQRG